MLIEVVGARWNFHVPTFFNGFDENNEIQKKVDSGACRYTKAKVHVRLYIYFFEVMRKYLSLANGKWLSLFLQKMDFVYGGIIFFCLCS